ncbi:cell division protein FtsX [Pseudooceanicola sediminis]|uniref:Cell division protein FtsX n=1 Tax=Pseudooceanicola sediminis TaxID=2211117 RepID=A0A399J609_9RHOB|nr:FtsX-like permease family protein [Pseudooceanicola sediminis]KAA2314622.1 cell division protein FtsX [Puniceibacterium sp. HSS470]RII39422.1 cell division protein FtsX [Pseudooceanicola sediminis]
MRAVLVILADLLRGDTQADRVVPPTGFTARLTLFAAAAMTFLAVFALALSLATGRLAHNWSTELARSATLRISTSQDQVAAQTAAALQVLQTTEGVASARALSEAEQQALLEPWFGPDVPIADLPVPQLIEIIETRKGYDAEGLRLRLAAEVPGAVLDDHTRWRRPLVRAASRIRAMGLLSLGLIGGIMAAMITLAAHSALAANAQVIAVLRLVGARDDFIARAFVRRFTLRAISGAILGLALGLGGILLLPSAQPEGGFLTGLGFQGWGWIWPFLLPLLAGAVAFWATRRAARRILRGLA